MIDDRKLQQLRNEGHDDVADAFMRLMGDVDAAGGIIRGLEAERNAALADFKLPCDVLLPPATVIREGCKLTTLLTALRVRGQRR